MYGIVLIRNKVKKIPVMQKSTYVAARRMDRNKEITELKLKNFKIILVLLFSGQIKLLKFMLNIDIQEFKVLYLLNYIIML